MLDRQALTHLSLRNYRSIAHMDLNLSPLTVFIGPNGSGKSNVLSAIRFLATTAGKDLESALSDFGGFHGLHREAVDTKRAEEVELQLAGTVTSRSSIQALDEYDLKFGVKQRGRITREEMFKFKRTRGRGRRRIIRVQGTEISVGNEQQQNSVGAEQLSKALDLATEQTTGLFTAQTVRISDQGDTEGIVKFASFLKSLVVFEPQVRDIVKPARLDHDPAEERLTQDGSNLATVLEQLAQRDADSFDRLISDMRGCLPGLEEIKFDHRGGASAFTVVQVREHGSRQPFDLADMSFGTVRMLALLTALHQLNPPPVMAIEEIDSGLHPYALDILVERLREASDYTQFLVSSHSPTFVNRLAPEELVICNRDPNTGASIIPAIQPEAIEAAIQAADGPRAGELWFAGVLDGVPRGA